MSDVKYKNHERLSPSALIFETKVNPKAKSNTLLVVNDLNKSCHYTCSTKEAFILDFLAELQESMEINVIGSS